jgi:hypothetical protein
MAAWDGFRSTRRTYIRRFVSALVLLAYVSTVAGIPLPSGAPLDSARRLFPCANSSCGCDSAEQCWQSCCCHSLAERLAWARKHGVRPPASAMAQARLAGLKVTGLAESHVNDCSWARESCCAAGNQEAPSTCCEHDSARVAKDANCCANPRDESEDGSRTGQIVAWRAMKCRGDSLNWLTAAPALIEVPVESTHESPLVGWLGAPSSDIADGRMPPPLLPPPERA